MFTLMLVHISNFMLKVQKVTLVILKNHWNWSMAPLNKTTVHRTFDFFRIPAWIFWMYLSELHKHFQPLSHNAGSSNKVTCPSPFHLSFENIFIQEFWNSLTIENDAIKLDGCRRVLFRILIFSNYILSKLIGVFFSSMEVDQKVNFLPSFFCWNFFFAQF